MARPISRRVAKAHERSVPIIAIVTAEPRGTIRGIQRELDGFEGMVAVEWDVVEGVRGLGPPGEEWLTEILGAPREGGGHRNDPTINQPVGFLQLIARLPEDSFAFLHNAQRFLEHWPEVAAVIQASANLRDRFKENNRTLVLLGPDIQLPPELQDDVVVLDEPLPAGEELGEIVDEAHEVRIGDQVVKLPLEPEQRERAIAFVTGLSAFGAEQVISLALTEQGCDLSVVRELRRRGIEQTPGLTIYKGRETYDDVGGVAYAKEFFGRVLESRAAPRCIVYIDEIEKALAGAGAGGSDLSGISQDILGTLLSFMEDNRCNGTICFGPPGCSKSLLAKATGNQGGIDTIQLDLGGLKGSLVGQSERNIRRALKVIQASSAGRSYWIATCNALQSLPGALLRRFTHGILFFDLPQEDEREAIWRVHVQAYELPSDQVEPLPDDRDWTGADIRNCCELAYQFGISLQEASRHILPVAISNPELVRDLRQEADNRYKSAATGDLYRFHRPSPSRPPSGRSVRLGTEPVP